MPIEMPKGLPFSVDTWTPCSYRKRHHFLTHAHKDHSQGITTHSSFPIYATNLTKILTLNYYPDLSDSLFVDIEVGQSIVINDLDESFTVTAFDANHCPGAVMFLFEGTFGNILHTGDCRLTPECLQQLPQKYLGKESRAPKCRLDYIFLDCTFGSFSSKMPSKHISVRQVINCIWKHPDASVVYLTCDLLGQEEILASVSQTFGSKIFIDKESNPECFQSLSVTIPEILSQDSSSRFHVFDGFPRLSERAETKLAEARANFRTEPLIIRPSAQWYVFEDVSSDAEKRKSDRFKEAMKDQFGIWHVCYSIHSSRDELEWALHLLAPRWVVSTTPPCRAMDLSYVKKHCSYSNLTSNEPIWKLLDINWEAPVVIEDVSEEVSAASSESVVETYSEYTLQSSQTVVHNKALLTVSPPGKGPSVTLFGRARLGLDNSTFHEEKLDRSETSYQKEDIEAQCNDNVDADVKEDVYECKVEEINIKKEEGKFTSSYSPNGSSNGFSEHMRKLYRNMHVPLPRPLPSLVDILNERKRAKRRFML